MHGPLTLVRINIGSCIILFATDCFLFINKNISTFKIHVCRYGQTDGKYTNVTVTTQHTTYEQFYKKKCRVLVINITTVYMITKYKEIDYR